MTRYNKSTQYALSGKFATEMIRPSAPRKGMVFNLPRLFAQFAKTFCQRGFMTYITPPQKCVDFTYSQLTSPKHPQANITLCVPPPTINMFPLGLFQQEKSSSNHHF